jgi:hypothetical protein
VLTLISGICFALLFFLALVIWTAPLVDLPSDSAARLAHGETYLTIDDIGWVALGGAGIGAGVMAIAASLGALRVGAVPKWAGWLGVVFGALSFGTVMFLGIFAWLAWIVVASSGLLVLGRDEGAAA